MKKLIIPILLLAMVACKKEEDKKEEVKPDPNAPVAFTKEAAVGTWQINKFEEYAIPSDTIKFTFNVPAGQGTFTLGSDNSYSTVLPLGSDNGTYIIGKLNGKDLLILLETGKQPDTNEVVLFTKSSFVISNKDAETRKGSNDYSKGYLSR
ncbi:MAG: hypothetical protein MUE96_04805 [Bacteroidia bacterium]|nr:hypothetical protein [Bacteroidia bacterium]